MSLLSPSQSMPPPSDFMARQPLSDSCTTQICPSTLRADGFTPSSLWQGQSFQHKNFTTFFFSKEFPHSKTAVPNQNTSATSIPNPIFPAASCFTKNFRIAWQFVCQIFGLFKEQIDSMCTMIVGSESHLDILIWIHPADFNSSLWSMSGLHGRT